MDNQAHPKIKNLLSQHNQVGVMLSKNPEVDQAAAGLALYLALRQLGKQVIVVSPTQPTVEISNLVGIDKVKNTLDADGSDLTVAFPYKEGEIEKVSYTLDNGYLNIVVKAGDRGLNFKEEEIQFKRGGGKVPPLMFFVGVPRLTDLGNLFNPDTFKDTTIVNIDNRAENQGFGDVIVVSPKFSSVSEQVAHLLSEIENVAIDQDIAQNLLSGISQATNDFQEPKTSYLAFEMAGVLMRKGAVRKKNKKEEKQEANGSFFPYQPQQPMNSQRMNQSFPRPQQFPRPQFPRPFPSQQQPRPVVNQPQAPIMQQPQAMQNQQTSQQPQPMMPQQPVQQTQRPINQPNKRPTPPEDWLTPKVYKGSTVL